MHDVPENLLYSKDHEWIEIDGDIGTIGISDHAQAELSDVVFVDLPEVGATVAAGDPVAVVESVKAASDVYTPVSGEILEINEELSCTGMKLCINSEYAPEYLKEAAEQYAEVWQINEAMFVHGRGHRKTTQQRHYEKLKEYAAKLEEYVEKIKICGEDRNSYSKTDHSATFMRIKTDYMGNDQLLPAYNVQVGVADEYIAVVDVNQYRSDMDCFIPLMNKFYTTYGFYPKYPVADAGYGSYNNYIFCDCLLYTSPSPRD